MNKHYILSLFDDTVKTVGVKFTARECTYTYKTRLALAAGDEVVVETPSNGLQVVTITRVDEEPDFDVNSVIDYKWIVCKVDRTEYDAALARDAELHKEIAKVQRRNHREAAKNALAQSLPGLATFLNAGKEPAPEVSPAFDKGRKARQSGYRAEDNEYPPGSMAGEQWAAGWRSYAKR